MQVRALSAAALLAVSVLACDRAEDPAGPPELELPPAERLDGIHVPPPPTSAAAPSTRWSAEPAPPPGRDGEVRLGMTRSELMTLTGGCLLRTYLSPGSARTLSAEVFQPREGECVKRFGANRISLIGGKVKSIEPGLDVIRTRRSSPPPNVPH
jgi:hypothetical protein